jgi:TonB family protein
VPRPSLTRSTIALVLSLGAHTLGAVWLLHALPVSAPHALPPAPMAIEFRPLSPRPSAPAAPKVASRPAARAPVRALAPRAHEAEAIAVAALPTSVMDGELLAGTGDSALAPSTGAEARAQVGGATAPGAAGEGPAPGRDLLAELQALLAARAARCYPPAAVRLGLTGTTTVAFCITATGIARDIAVRGSSGEALLDRAATACVVEGAGPLPPLPDCLVVPVEFRRP